MDLEGVSRDDLLEAAAELQLRQTAALQGEAFMGPRPATLFSNPREVKDASSNRSFPATVKGPLHPAHSQATWVPRG